MPKQSRFRTGIALAKISWRTLRDNKSLMAFPIAGMAVALAIAIIFVLPGILLLMVANVLWAAIVLFAVSGYLAAFTGVFFGVGLCAATDRALRGESCTLRDGLHVSRERIPQIAKWALVVTTVAIIIRAIEARFDGAGGAIVGALAGVAWALVSFLAVPVITFEGAGPINALKRSSSLFKQRWGQQVTGQAVTGGIVGVLIVLPGIILIVLGIAMAGGTSAAAGIALAVVGGLLVIIGSVLANTLNQILSVALYHYAVDGEGVGAFNADVLQAVVRPKRGARAV